MDTANKIELAILEYLSGLGKGKHEIMPILNGLDGTVAEKNMVLRRMDGKTVFVSGRQNLPKGGRVTASLIADRWHERYLELKNSDFVVARTESPWDFVVAKVEPVEFPQIFQPDHVEEWLPPMVDEGAKLTKAEHPNRIYEVMARYKILEIFCALAALMTLLFFLWDRYRDTLFPE